MPKASRRSGLPYDETMVRFPLRKGDLLMLDNMLVAHGRMPFTGARKVAVAMGETVWLKDVEAGDEP